MEEIGDIDGGLHGQTLADRTQDREPAHTGIEDSDRPRVAFRSSQIHLV